MNTEAANRWLTLLANAGVLVGIVFLALEVRQSNQIAIAATEMSVWDKYLSMNQAVFESDDVAALLVKAMDRDAEFTPEENERLSGFVYSFINIWYAVEIAHDNDMISDKTFSNLPVDIRNLPRWYPALRPLLRNYLNDYQQSGAEHSYIYSELRRAVDESNP